MLPNPIRSVFFVPLVLCACFPALAQQSGKAEYDAFTRWRKTGVNSTLDWGQAVGEYRKKLTRDGRDEAGIHRAMQAIEAYGEAELYDRVYEEPPAFNTKPNRLLMDAVSGRPPGEALDVAMGQGRNSIYLASQGWKVTGFDVAEAGLRKAEQAAAAKGLAIKAVLSSDEDFDFGRNRWDLIAVLYAIEKRSVYRVRDALRPGGLVVVEAGHKSASGAHFEYESDELLKIFEGFRVLRYEEPTEISDWGKKPIRLVRLIAEKPR